MGGRREREKLGGKARKESRPGPAALCHAGRGGDAEVDTAGNNL